MSLVSTMLTALQCREAWEPGASSGQKTRTRNSCAPKMGEESLLRILFMLIVYRGLPRDECDEILTSRRFFHTGFYTAITGSS
jgi:hypothetical protein